MFDDLVCDHGAGQDSYCHACEEDPCEPAFLRFKIGTHVYVSPQAVSQYDADWNIEVPATVIDHSHHGDRPIIKLEGLSSTAVPMVWWVFADVLALAGE